MHRLAKKCIYVQMYALRVTSGGGTCPGRSEWVNLAAGHSSDVFFINVHLPTVFFINVHLPPGQGAQSVAVLRASEMSSLLFTLTELLLRYSVLKRVEAVQCFV